MWKSTEIEYLKENYTLLGAQACGVQIGKTKDAVFKQAQRLGLCNKKNIIENGQKRCSKCKETKSTKEFHRSNASKSGLNSSCKVCWRAHCVKNANKISKVRRAYHAANRRTLSAKRCIYVRMKCATDPQWRLRFNLRRRVKHALKGSSKAAPTLTLLGCTVAQLKTHLESKFQMGMNWDNYGKAWHIDHIIPCASFDLTKGEEQKECFHFSNLQPLLALDNLRKGSKRQVLTLPASSE